MKVRSIPAHRDQKLLRKDLEDLCRLAREKGASAAEAIKAQEVSFDSRVADKYKIKDLPRENRSLHWPARYPQDSVEDAVRAFAWGVFFKLDLKACYPDPQGGPFPDEGLRRAYENVYELVTAVESQAFYRGYHLSLGLAAGNCRFVFCSGEKSCRALTKGRSCLHPYKSRPSLEAVGIDGAALAEKLGWSSRKKGGKKSAAYFLTGLVLVG